jgi:hypothetical protein
MDDEERRVQEMEGRWEQEFGPQISPLRKWVTGLLLIAAFFAIIALAFVSAPSR